MLNPVSFSKQFFAVSTSDREDCILLAGGLLPISKPRSAYQASLVCFDYRQGEIVWRQDWEKSHPFRKVSYSNGVCALILPQNFVRSPIGMYRFDLERGEKIEPDQEVSGWKLQDVEGTPQGFLFSWVSEQTSLLRVVSHREGVIAEKRFPYASHAGGKTIERVFSAGENAIIAFFSIAKRTRMVYSLECWNLDADKPVWKKKVTLKHIVRNEAQLICWNQSGRTFSAEVYSIETGKRLTRFKAEIPNVVNLVPIEGSSFALQAFSGIVIANTDTGAVTPLPTGTPDPFLDFGALAVDRTSRKLFVLTAGNHQRPGTQLNIFDL